MTVQRQQYHVQRGHNRGSMGETQPTLEYLETLGVEGWIFAGQYHRQWYAEGRWQTEIFDIFRRPLEDFCP